MEILTKIGLVALGSALGGLSRWGMALGVARLLGTALPWGTLVINVLGSFFLGWFTAVLSERAPLNGLEWLPEDDLRLMVSVGFTGAFTTFSTFEFETHGLLRDGHGLAALAYLIGSVSLGLMAVHLGFVMARSG